MLRSFIILLNSKILVMNPIMDIVWFYGILMVNLLISLNKFLDFCFKFLHIHLTEENSNVNISIGLVVYNTYNMVWTRGLHGCQISVSVTEPLIKIDIQKKPIRTSFLSEPIRSENAIPETEPYPKPKINRKK